MQGVIVYVSPDPKLLPGDIFDLTMEEQSEQFAAWLLEAESEQRFVLVLKPWGSDPNDVGSGYVMELQSKTSYSLRMLVIES